jgi:anaerobic selenocysteine-containing dehydrogenase
MQSISRRDFLKLGAASTAVLALESQFGSIVYAAETLVEGGRSVNRVSGLPRSFLPSTCIQCPAGCGIIGYVEESRLVKIGGNTKHISNEGSLCARGQAGINALYDPNRILKPLKRAGTRGSGEWTEISWEEAMDEVAGRIGGLGDKNEFVFITDDLDRDDLGRRFTWALGSGNALEGIGAYNANKLVATDLTWGIAGDTPDVRSSKYILSFGANPLETHPEFVGFSRRLIDGMLENRAKVVVFDVRLTYTSSKSTEFHYVAPGSYGLLALSIANVIMQEGLHDANFINQWTNVSPAQIAQHLAEYTPERAEAETGVSASVIRRVAAEFATTKPATTMIEPLVSSASNAVQAERAAMLLDIITGNIDTRGGLCFPREFVLAEPAPAPANPGATILTNPPAYPLASQQVISTVMDTIKQRQVKVGALMSHRYNIAYSNPDLGTVEDVLKDETLVPFHVAVSPYETETAIYADIILPEATYLEDWSIEVRPSPELVPFVSLRQPVVPALKESKSFFDITKELANMIGGGMEQYFAFNGVQDYLKGRIANIPGLNNVGGMDYLKQHGVWYDPTSRPDYGAFRSNGFNTPSGRLEVFSGQLAAAGFPPLPSYEPVVNVEGLEANDLVLTIFDTAVQFDSKTANCMWLSEIEHNNPVWLNPETAHELGIEEGDHIKLTRKNGDDAKIRSIESTAYLTEGIHPKVIAMSNGVGHTAFGAIAQAEEIPYPDPSVPPELSDPNTELVWWGHHGFNPGHGVNAKQMVPVDVDPVGGGQAWGEMVVTLAKAEE